MRRNHRGHGRIAAGLLQAAIDIVGPHLEALLVIGFAAESGDGHVERAGVGRRSQ
jgi:mannose/fructose-specific phosphotransferase system component IIA